jgi:HD-like signal output (HDOD) protein
MRQEWEMEFVPGGQEALEALARTDFDVVLSDMRMPGMDGAQLLNEVRQRHPHVIRIVLSGQSDKESVLRSIGSTHQYLSKPCDPDKVRATVARACALRDLLEHRALRELMAGMQVLPSLPSLYAEIVQEMQSEDASIKKASAIIAKDLGMSTKILQVINSAYFGLPGRVTSLHQAVSLLGLDIVKALVLSVQVFSQFKDVPSRVLSLDVLWRHSLTTASLAREIALAEGAEATQVEEVFMAGLLHDVGVLALVTNVPDRYLDALQQAEENCRPSSELELEILGATHAEVGAYLLGLWGLGDSIVEALAFHHAPIKANGCGFSPLTAVHVANVFEGQPAGVEKEAVLSRVDMGYLESIGLANRLSEWHERCAQGSTQMGERV